MTHSSYATGLADNQLDFDIVIAVPARLGSTRLPRKPLALLGGKPLVVRVAERVEECAQFLCKKLSLDSQKILTLVATDSQKIIEALSSTSIKTVMTSSELPSGTDRICAALEKIQSQESRLLKPSSLVINLQGDEPFFHFEDIASLVSSLIKEAQIPLGTLAFEQSDSQQFLRTSVVKVVCNALGNALYFSRSPIPWPRQKLGASHAITQLDGELLSNQKIPFLQHIGVYAFRFAALQSFTQMPPSVLENTEGLEQLRALEAGWSIKVVRAAEAPFGIDTSEDLLRAEIHLARKGHTR